MRVMRPEGLLCVSGTRHSIHKCAFIAQCVLGADIFMEVAWAKPNAAPHLACTRLADMHETLLFIRRDTSVRPSDVKFNYAAMRSYDGGADPFKREGKQMRSVWTITTPRKWEKRHGKHSCQKPEALLDRVVLGCSNPGDLVLDPFMGSGTTGVIAVRHGRRFIGCDPDPASYDLARLRLHDERGAA